MSTLTPQQRAYLRKLAHPLKVSVQVGKQGLTDTLTSSIEQVLLAHELAKIKFVSSKDAKQQIAEQIAERTHSQLVALIGNTAILYRAHPQKDKRKITLPR